MKEKMTNLIDYHIPEAIQIRVTKNSSVIISPSLFQSPLIEIGVEVVNNNINNNTTCNFCVDPQLTSFLILQSLLVRAFNLQWYATHSFRIFYL